MKTELETRNARARASRIREGIHSYLNTLADIAAAYAERDWAALGYEDWSAYVDGEFGADRLRLSPAYRQKAIEELRLAGLSQRAIASAVGASVGTVNDALASSGVQNRTPDDVIGLDGKTYRATPTPPAETASPLAAALTEAIEGTVERVANGPTWAEHELLIRDRIEHGESVVVSMRSGFANLITWAEAEGKYIRIDRRTEWGNPFELPADGDRGAVIAAYAEHYLPFKPSLLARLEELRGKALGCWCAPERCHGDVLVERLC